MIWLPILALACTALPGATINPTATEWDRSIRCTDYGELEHCYSLRDSKDSDRRYVGISRACKGNYRDSCALLYDLEVETSTEGYVFTAAERACQGGSGKHCKIAIDFAAEDPELQAIVEASRPKHQARLDALEAWRPASEP